MKLIKLTQETINTAKAAFDLYLNQLQTPGEAIDFKLKYDSSLNIPENLRKAHIILSAKAYLKMTQLVKASTKELAWHGFVTKRGSTYIISDVVCYPQKASAATVESDDDKYPQWLMSLSNDQINSMRFQGHSHVNFGVSPSNTDIQNWATFVNNIGPNDFYIFCILNKSGDAKWVIYDKQLNIVYEQTDIDVSVYLSKDCFLDVWASTQIKENITERSVVSYSTLRQTSIVDDILNKHITQSTTKAKGYSDDYDPVGITESGYDVYEDMLGVFVYDDNAHKDYLTKKEIKTQVYFYNESRNQKDSKKKEV